jgi:hypothetical protein
VIGVRVVPGLAQNGGVHTHRGHRDQGGGRDSRRRTAFTTRWQPACPRHWGWGWGRLRSRQRGEAVQVTVGEQPQERRGTESCAMRRRPAAALQEPPPQAVVDQRTQAVAGWRPMPLAVSRQRRLRVSRPKAFAGQQPRPPAVGQRRCGPGAHGCRRVAARSQCGSPRCATAERSGVRRQTLGTTPSRVISCPTSWRRSSPGHRSPPAQRRRGSESRAAQTESCAAHPGRRTCGSDRRLGSPKGRMGEALLGIW